MIIYPAIDLKDGKCVRLSQGKFDNVKIYSERPYKMAEEFIKCGAEFIHVVDLDGAKDGIRTNAEAIRDIVKSAGIVPVQLGGGIRDIKSIEEALKLGVRRVIIGTAAVNNPQFVAKAVKEYGDAIAVGIDAKDEMVATHGWLEVSNISAIELAQKMAEIGVKTIIYTDIATDGMLMGPNIEAMSEMADSVAANIIASGGISCKADVINLLSTKVAGVIIGKAIYENRLDLKEVVQEVKR